MLLCKIGDSIEKSLLINFSFFGFWLSTPFIFIWQDIMIVQSAAVKILILKVILI